MIRRPPRSTLSSSSAASDVYKRQYIYSRKIFVIFHPFAEKPPMDRFARNFAQGFVSVSYTHLTLPTKRIV